MLKNRGENTYNLTVTNHVLISLVKKIKKKILKSLNKNKTLKRSTYKINIIFNLKL